MSFYVRSILLLSLSTLSISVTIPLNQLPTSQFPLHRSTAHGPANLPVPNPSKSFWIDSSPDANPLRAEGSTGSLTDDADVCIIGSGITGISAAYHLSQAMTDKKLERPLKAVVLEARDFCSGATGRNGGHLTPAKYKHYSTLQNTYGKDQALRSIAIEDYTVASLLGIIESNSLADSVNLAAWGHNELFLTEQDAIQAKADLEAAKTAGLDVSSVSFLDKDQMDEQYGTPYPGFRSPGHNLWPLKLVTELYKLAKAQASNFSLSIHTRTPVTSISPATLRVSSGSTRRYIAHTPRGQISCAYVVHATNAHASHLLPHFTGPAGIIPTRGQAVALRAGVGRNSLGMSGWGNGGSEYWFPMPATHDEPEGNPLVILGGGREVTSPEFELYEEDDSVLNEDVSRALADYLPNLFKGRYEVGRKAEMEWSGIMARTKLGDPFVGPVLDAQGGNSSFKGQFIVAGYTGHGMPRAFACAKVVVDMIISELAGRQWAIPEWLPERYLTWNRIEATHPEEQ